MNIYQRMLKATEEIQTVAKNLSVQVTKTSSYKAVGEKDILDAVKPIETKYGIYSYPHERKIIETSLLETENQYGAKKQLFMRIETLYRFVNIDNPSEHIDIVSYGDGIDTGDKATGKAMTYCDKYALMKAYKISTGDDPDQNPSETLKSKKDSMTAYQKNFINKLPQTWKDNVQQHYGTLDITTQQANEVIFKWNEAQDRARAKQQEVNNESNK